MINSHEKGKTSVEFHEKHDEKFSKHAILLIIPLKNILLIENISIQTSILKNSNFSHNLFKNCKKKYVQSVSFSFTSFIKELYPLPSKLIYQIITIELPIIMILYLFATTRA